ncbi:hypothetical protein LCGC14_1142490, partial [marine sediment metagenome]
EYTPQPEAVKVYGKLLKSYEDLSDFVETNHHKN